MTVKWVLLWKPDNGSLIDSKVASTILFEVSKCFKSFNGVKNGQWQPKLDLYAPVLKNHLNKDDYPRGLVGVSLPEQPKMCYYVLHWDPLVLEADSKFQTIMENLESWKVHLVHNVEGIQYQLGDFQLRVGKLVSEKFDNLKGILMEIEYCPISSWKMSHKIMSELLEILQKEMSKKSLPGHFVHMPPEFEEFGLSDKYSPQHTAVQYASILKSLAAVHFVDKFDALVYDYRN